MLWGLMGMYLLNISVDTDDLNPEYIAEDLTINDQESFIEIIVEKVFGYDNAIEEYDDHDTNDHNRKKSSHIDMSFLYVIEQGGSHNSFGTRKQGHPHFSMGLTQGHSQLDTPPPKS